MDTSVLSFVVALCGSIIILLLAVVAFFIKKFIVKVDDISIAVSNICINVEHNRTEFESFEKTNEQQHVIMDKCLASHANNIHDHEKRLIKIGA